VFLVRGLWGDRKKVFGEADKKPVKKGGIRGGEKSL
jgi:hypothetical protein